MEMLKVPGESGVCALQLPMPGLSGLRIVTSITVVKFLGAFICLSVF